MSLLQNLINTIYFQLQTLQTTYPSLAVTYGLPAAPPTGLTVALEHDKSKVDEQYELAGYRRRPKGVFSPTFILRRKPIVTTSVKPLKTGLKTKTCQCWMLPS